MNLYAPLLGFCAGEPGQAGRQLAQFRRRVRGEMFVRKRRQELERGYAGLPHGIPCLLQIRGLNIFGRTGYIYKII